MDEIKNLDEIINKLNDQLGLMGNNLIEKQFELDYLNEVNQKLNAVNEYLYKLNKRLVDQLNKNQCFKKMNY